ncbi:MAG: ATP synthase F0 subunit B [Nitrospirae bacterium]|nr:ATP synthase F0 subunit B [Nitrospirota bacterium]
MKRFSVILLLFIALAVSSPMVSMAQEGGGHGNAVAVEGGHAAGEQAEGGHKEEMVEFFSTGFMWTVINFTLIAFVLVKFAKEPIQEALRQRRETIEKTMKDAAEAKELALKGLEEARRREKDKDIEIESILSDARATAERERKSLIEQGERISRDMVERARLSIDVELQRAKDDLRAEAVTLAMEIAADKISRETTDDDQKRLLTEYIGRMENRN